MSEDLLLRYANASMPPAERVRSFVSSDERLQWVNPFLRRQPAADISFCGGTLRTILLGHVPETLHVTMHNIASHDIRTTLAPYGDFHLEGGDSVMTFTPQNSGRQIFVATSPQERKEFTVDGLTYRYRDHEIDDATRKGLDDIKHRTLRAVGYPLRTFAHAPLAALRGLRLAAQHALAVDAETWHAIARSMPRLNRVERNENGEPRFALPRHVLGAALLEILAASGRYGSALVHASGFMSLLSPTIHDAALEKSVAAMRTLDHADTRASHGLNALSTTTTLAGLLALQPNADTLAKNLSRDYSLHQFPAAHAAHCNVDDLAWLLGNLRMLHDVDPVAMSPSTFEKTFGNHRGRNLLALMRAVFLHEGAHHVARERYHVASRLLNAYDEKKSPPKLLRGRDLDTLGIPPGHLYRRLLAKVRDAQLAGSITNRDEALHLLRLELTKM